MADLSEKTSGSVIQIKEKRPPTEDASLAVRTSGLIEPGDVHVFMPIEIFEELERRFLKAPEQEMTGILLGDLYRCSAHDYLEIEGFLPLRDSGARFTQETWEALYAELDRKKSETNIIGWFYSDPSGNLALEGYRQFVQESFFDDPYQIAMGIDPSSGRYRLFQWKQGELSPLQGHDLFAPVSRAEDLRRLAARPLADVRGTTQGGVRIQSVKQPPARSLAPTLLVLILALLAIANALWSSVLVERIDSLARQIQSMETRQNELTKTFEEVELAARAAAGRLMEPATVATSRFDDLERRLTEVRRSYARLKIHLNRTQADLKKLKQEQAKKPPKPASRAPERAAASPSRPAVAQPQPPQPTPVRTVNTLPPAPQPPPGRSPQRPVAASGPPAQHLQRPPLADLPPMFRDSQGLAPAGPPSGTGQPIPPARGASFETPSDAGESPFLTPHDMPGQVFETPLNPR